MKKKDVVEYFGSPTNVTKALKITSGSISQWGEVVPFLSAYAVWRLTDGKVDLVESDYERLKVVESACGRAQA